MDIHVPIKLGTLDPHVANAMLSVVIAFILPWINAFVNNRKMSNEQRTAIAAGMAGLFAMLQTFVTGGFNFADWAQAFTIMWPLSLTFYRNVALNIGVREFENATSKPHLRDDVGDEPLPTGSTVEAMKTVARVVKTVEQGEELVDDITNAASNVTHVIKRKQDDDN